MFGTNGIIPVAEVNGNNGNGFGNGIWVLIILFAIFGGFGGNRFGAGNNGGNVDATIQRGFDNQGVMSQLQGIGSGLCSLGYDQLREMNTLNMNVMQQSHNQQTSMDHGFNELMRQLAECCCGTKAAISDLRYEMSSGFCNVGNAIAQATQTIVQNDNNNYRMLHDEIVGNQMEAYRTKLFEQSLIINSLGGYNGYTMSGCRPSYGPGCC